MNKSWKKWPSIILLVLRFMGTYNLSLNFLGMLSWYLDQVINFVYDILNHLGEHQEITLKKRDIFGHARIVLFHLHR